MKITNLEELLQALGAKKVFKADGTLTKQAEKAYDKLVDILALRKINNNYLGDFYIEELENREEQDRVKLYDSDKNYLDYLPLERCDDTDPTFKEQYNGYVEMLENFKTIPDLMDWLVCDCDFIGSKSDAIKYVLTEWNLPDDECDPLDNEWVNRIGDIYVVISEY